MFRFLLSSLIIFSCCLGACKNNTSSANTLGGTQTPRDSTLAEPDASDLLQILQGKWQSAQDSTYFIEIAGSKMRHYNNNQMSLETDIEIDGNCLSNACQVDSLDTENGWCFVEKGQFDAQCNLILKCDKEVLQYRALGAANPALVFRKK